MESYREKIYKKFVSTLFKEIHPATGAEFELYRRYFRKNYQKFMPKDKNAPILDIGCGMGHFLYFLQQEGHTNILGIDVSGECVDFCKSKAFNVIKADIFEFLESNKQKFECIIMNDILEHLKKEEIVKVLDLIRANLKEGGTFVCKVPNSSNPITGSRTRYKDFTHEVGFTEESLRQILMILGFKQVKIYPQDIYVLKNPVVNILAKIFVFLLHKMFRFMFLIQGAETTRIFTKSIIGVARK